YYYKVEQEDVAGNISTPSAALPITIKTNAQTPGTPALDPNHPAGGSDTGVSASDSITNDAQPWVIVPGIEPTAQQITLLRATSAGGPFTPVKTVTSFTFNADGTVSMQDPGPVPADGTYYYEAQQLDVAGNTSL